MSTSKGSSVRVRPQKHQNRTAFKNNLHDTSTKTKFLNSLDVNGVCSRCKDIIDWKIKYKKYKMLNAPKKCVCCEQKTIKHAYHVMCGKCAREKDVCAKCCKKSEVIPESLNDGHSLDINNLLKSLPERKRRTILRFINKNQADDQKITSEMIQKVEEMLKKMDNNADLEGEDDSDDFDDSSEEQC